MKISAELLEDEYWWGGSSALGEKFPLEKDSVFHMDRSYRENQTMPLWLSTKGRYVYGKKALDVTFQSGSMTVESDGEAELFQGGSCLREAYLSAMRRHFPF